MMTAWAGSALLVCGLGIAPLALNASQALHWERDSLARSGAVLLAHDLAHRLHLNASATAHYRLDWGQQPVALSCLDRPCTRTDWAQADLSQWRAQVARVLPEGDAWLQAGGEGSNMRWLVLAWTSTPAVDVPAAQNLPAPCPARKRCLSVVLHS